MIQAIYIIVHNLYSFYLQLYFQLFSIKFLKNDKNDKKISKLYLYSRILFRLTPSEKNNSDEIQKIEICILLVFI